jgi:hypothetical protein
MGPSDRPPLPYTVSAPDWNIFSPYVKYLDELEDDSVCDWLGSVLSVWTSVYAVSKVVVMALMHYGVEVGNQLNTLPSDADDGVRFISWMTPPTASWLTRNAPKNWWSLIQS